MASPEDLAFGQIAVERKFVTAAQVAECLEALTKQAQLGVFPKSLADELMERGHLSQYLVKEVYKAQGKTEGFPHIAGYEIEAKIGHGGMGTVYRAKQKSLERDVAIKVLASTLSRDRTFVNRFLREARAVAALNHENIIVGIDVGKSDDHYFFAMEYVHGETVHEILRREQRMDERRALGIVRQVALALAHAHEHGLVHRDVKPGNIMVTDEAVAKLCDLGLAKSIHQDGSLTQSGTTHGTPHYMSPEQARGSFEIDIRSDIYSLGATLYHMVVGDVPFSGASAAVILLKHLSEAVPSPKARRPELSDGICHLVETMMAKKPEQRYQLPQELIADVDRVLEGQAPHAARPAAGESSVMPVSAPADPGGPDSKSTTAAGTAVAPATAKSGRSAPLLVAGSLAAGAVLMLLGVQLFGGNGGTGAQPSPPTRTAGVPPPATSEPPVTPVTTATVDPGAAQRTAEEALAAQSLQALRDYVAKRPDDHFHHIQQLETFLERFGKTAVALEARRLQAEQQRAFAGAAQTALESVQASVKGWVADGRLGDAIGELENGVARPYAGTEAADAAERQLRDLIRLRFTRLIELEAQAERLESRGRYTQAIATWEQIKLLGMSEHTARAVVEMRRLQGLVVLEAKLAEERAEREARERWLEYSTNHYSVQGLLESRAYGKVLARIDEALGKPAFERVKPWLERDRRLIQQAATIFANARGALDRSIGHEVTLRRRRVTTSLIRGKLLAIESQRLVIRLAGGGKTQLHVVDVAVEDLRRLGGAAKDDGAGWFAEACLRFCDGELAKAKLAFDSAKQAGEEVEPFQRDLRERRAFGLLAAARTHWEAGEYLKAKQALAELQRVYGDTDVAADNAEDVQDRLDLADDFAEQAEATRRLDTAEGRALLGPGVTLAPGAPAAAGPPHIEVHADRLLLAKLPPKGGYGQPECMLYEGPVEDHAWARSGGGVRGPVETRLAFRPVLRGDEPLEVTLEFRCATGTTGRLLSVADPIEGPPAGAAPVSLWLADGGAVLVVKESRKGAAPRELMRIEGVALADGTDHAVTIRIGRGQVAVAVDGAPERSAEGLNRAAGQVAIDGQGDRVTYRALTVKGVVSPRWAIHNPWVREKLGR